MKTTDKRKSNAKKIDISLLETLYNLHAPSGDESDVQNYCTEHAEATGATVTLDNIGNLYITKGNAKSYGCFVAHLDEVHQTRSKYFKTHIIGNTVYGYDHRAEAFSGIGADDKNGIYIILKMLEEAKEMKAVLFVEEEIGCIGSRGADMQFFDDCKYVVQIDRKGNKDFITTAGGQELCGDSFFDVTEAAKFGYIKAAGAMTDIMQLKENGLNIAGCNLSCGYYNPHTDNENTNLADLQNCFNLCLHILDIVTTMQPHTPTKTYYNYNQYAYNAFQYGYNTPLYDNKEAKEAREEEEIRELEKQEIENALEDIIYSDEYIDKLYYMTKKEGDEIIKQVRKVIGYNVSKTTIANVFYDMIGCQLYYTKADNK